MTADFELILVLRGNKSDIKNMLEVFAHYCHYGDREVCFNFVKVNGKYTCWGDDAIDWENITDELVAELSSSGEILIDANGPYGSYIELNDVDLFREMAEVAPDANFEAEISGYQQYSVQNLKCRLEDKKMYITTFFQSNSEAGDAWVEDFMKKIPLEKFKKLFEISGGDFNEDNYKYTVIGFRNLIYGAFEEVDFDYFVDKIEDYKGKTELNKRRFKKIMKTNLPSYGIRTPEDFEYDYKGGETKEYVYNPVTKAYEGKSKPLFDGRDPLNINDILALGLREQGLDDDEDAVANLSVDEAYEALGAALFVEDEE